MKKSKKTLRLIAISIGMAPLFGCSTTLTVSSNPEGARMSFKGQEKTTPFIVSYSNLWGKDLPYTIYKKNYESQVGFLPTSSGELNIVLPDYPQASATLGS